MNNTVAVALPNTAVKNTVRKLKLAMVSLIMTIFMFGNSMTVFASNFDIKSYVSQYGKGNISQGHWHAAQADPTWVEVELNGTKYYVDPDGISEAAAHINSLQTQQQNTADITSQIKGLDNLGITPNMDGASQAISGFVPAINFFLGLGVTVITVGMTILTTIDICYIVFPVIRGGCENMKAEGKGVSRSRTEKSGQTKLLFISDEAEYAINSAETTQTGKNPVIIYLKKRSAAIIIVSVAIFILLTGNLSVLTNIAIKGASGIINLIGEMGK